MYKDFLKKSFQFSYGFIFSFLINFIITITLARILLPEDFGKSSLFTLTVTISMLLVLFGNDQSFIRFFYEEKEEDRTRLLYDSLFLPTVLLFILIISILFFYESISILIFNEINFPVIVFLILGIVGEVYLRFALLVIRMQQKGLLYSFIEVLSKSLNLIFIIVFYFIFGKSYKIIVFSHVISIFLVLIFAISIEKKFWKLSKESINFNLRSKFHFISYGFPLLMTVLITYLMQSVDKIAIRNFSTLNELGIYAAAFKIISLLSIFQSIFKTVWVPIALEKYKQEGENEKKLFFSNVTNFISLLMITIAMLIISGKDFIVLLLGKNYQESAKLIPLLVIMPVLYTISETTVIGITFLKKTYWHFIIGLLTLITNIAFNALLIPSFGSTGAAFGTFISFILFFFLRTSISFKYYKFDLNLFKIGFGLSSLGVFSLISIFTSEIIMGILLGTFFLIINLLCFRNEVLIIFKSLKKVKLK